MGIAGAEGDAWIYLRLLGAFVAGVGASYLYPLLLAALGAPDRPGRLPAVIEVTALVRTGVALFVSRRGDGARPGDAVALRRRDRRGARRAPALAAGPGSVRTARRLAVAERDRGCRPAQNLAQALAGLLAVTATYVSFLLWAQFGFLELLTTRLAAGAGPIGPGGADGPGAVRLVMAAMGITGLLVSLATAPLLGALTRSMERRAGLRSAGRAARLPVIAGLVLSAVAPLAGLACRSLSAFVAVAALVGGATACLTVALAAHLRTLLPVRRLGLAVGAATGAAYFLCNLPGLFDAAPAVQAVTVAAVCLVAAVVLGAAGDGAPERPGRTLPGRLYSRAGLAAAVVSFALLVGLDSAVFAYIQQTPALAAATWGDGGRTLAQGTIHLAAALAVGALLDLAGGALFAPVLVGTGALFVAGFALIGPAGPVGSVGWAWAGGALYAVGISAYSVALVLYPAGRPDAPGTLPARWRSALVYGLSGWLGSALGVGMAQDLHRVPRAVPLAVLAALVAIWGGLRWQRPRSARAAASGRGRGGGGAMGGATALLAVLGCVPVVLSIVLASGPGAGAARAASRPGQSGPGRPDAVARGRRVYIAEGCIHCHSEYVRPGTRDEILWGPHRQHGAEGEPPLIGVRRQGPDLTNVGIRHTAAWQRLHLIDPRSLEPGSRMPSYASLFAGDGTRGADLVAYLQSLGRDAAASQRAVVARAPVPERAGSVAAGRALFAGDCAPCHGPAGHGDGPLAAAVRGADPDGEMARTMDLTKGAFWAVSWSPVTEPLEADLARTIRFGIPGTPMPGHEMLTDEEVRDLVAYVEALARSRRDDVAQRAR